MHIAFKKPIEFKTNLLLIIFLNAVLIYPSAEFKLLNRIKFEPLSKKVTSL